MFTFAVLSGFRRGEILDLSWKDVDFGRGVVTVESSERYRTKFGKVRFFPLTDEIRSLLNGIACKSEYVFPKVNGRPYSEDYPTRKFNMAVRLAELDEALTFHSMRRTLATWMREAGVDLGTIGLFALVGTPYTIKFLWAPLIDALDAPLLSRRLGRRRGWLVLSQRLTLLEVAAMVAVMIAAAGASWTSGSGAEALEAPAV